MYKKDRGQYFVVSSGICARVVDLGVFVDLFSALVFLPSGLGASSGKVQLNVPSSLL